MPPLDLNTKEYRLKEKYGGAAAINKRDVLSAAMYPKVWTDGAFVQGHFAAVYLCGHWFWSRSFTRLKCIELSLTLTPPCLVHPGV